MNAICNLLSESFYLKLATTCKNLFLSLVVVRLVIFFKADMEKMQPAQPRVAEILDELWKAIPQFHLKDTLIQNQELY